MATATQSDQNFLERMGWAHLFATQSDVVVTTETALGVPAVWAAVNFLSGTLAGLPLHVYERKRSGRARVSSGVAKVLSGAVNDGMSSFEWRKGLFDAVFTGGRHFTYIERTNGGRVVNLLPVDHTKVTVKMRDGRKEYKVQGVARPYASDEIVDVPFMLKSDMVSHRGPIATNREAIGMAIAASNFGAKSFQSGGLPPLVMQGPFTTGAGAERASDDIAKTLANLAADGRPVMAIPVGHELKGLGFNPKDMQLLELQRFCVEQIARIYSLPPVFLQDLTHGTFSNTEQQDLHFVKHTLKRWIEQVEQELNLKLFGRNAKFYVEFNVDGLLRGDFKTRMEGYGHAVQNGIRTPNEVRRLENLEDRPEGDDLMIQGGTVPIASQGAESNEQ